MAGGGGGGRLGRMAEGHRAPLIVACACSAAASLSGLVPYWGLYEILTAGLRDDGAPGHIWSGRIWSGHGHIWMVAGVVGASLIVRHLAAALATGLAHYVGFDILCEVRRRLVAKSLRLPMGFFLDRPAGRLANTFQEQVEILELFFSHQLPDMVAALVTPFLCLAVMAALDWRLAVAALGILPLAFLGNAWMMHGHGERIGRYFGMIRAINVEAVQYIQGMEVVRSFAAGGGLGDRLARAIDAFRAYALEWQGEWLPGWAVYAVSTGAALLFVAPAGLWLHGRGDLDAPTFLALLLLGSVLGAPLQKVTVYSELFLRVRKAAEAVGAVLDADELPVAPGGAGGVADRPDVVFDGVSFAYGGKQALKEVSFTAPAGSVTALIGLSGAGKSTVAQLIARFWDVGAGSVRLGGADVRGLAPERLKALVSFVFQDNALLSGTVADTLRMGRPDAGDAALEAAARAARCHDFIAALPDGYATPVGEGGARLSGGERQRLAIARAILKESPILVLDEPTAFADAENAALIQAGLSELMAGRTVIVIAHHLDSVKRADSIVVLHEGRVVAQAPHETLMATVPLYRQLVEQQAEALQWRIPGAVPGRIEEM